ncbi:hypothetical protein VIA_000012 [Vibrio orientalis CIP 102891 = ATCC 33934]|uniref:Transposase n=1 Tax=Vibrio orientalis CIP 102891 = ATCC 33934 TaxID=675816 RepID=A0ABM9Z718_VIBOR|nr:hypothetical protein VIA_000012 [Vibrio orientalis CIP 102891 = ATCC 33934]
MGLSFSVKRLKWQPTKRRRSETKALLRLLRHLKYLFEGNIQ